MYSPVLPALSALRDATDLSDPALNPAWREVSDVIDRIAKRYEARDREEIRQRALVKVFGFVQSMDADIDPEAGGWLASVVRAAAADLLRKWDPLRNAIPLSSTTNRQRSGARIRGRALDLSPAGVSRSFAGARVEAAVMRHVERWEAQRPRSKRSAESAQRIARAALLAVLGHDADEIRAELGADVSRECVYKWVERGRETVLIPALERAPEPECRALRKALIETRRADHGRPRRAA